MKLSIKISSGFLILLSINLVACLGEKGPQTQETQEIPVHNQVIGSAIEECDEPLASINVFEQVYGDFQQVHNNCIVWNENNGTLVVKYRSSNANVTGLDLNIHYNSAQLNNIVVNDVLRNDLIVDGILEIDNDNEDGDSSTDMVVEMGWAALLGQWPGQEEVNLVTLEFTRVSDTQEEYIINYSSSSNAAGYELLLGK